MSDVERATRYFHRKMRVWGARHRRDFPWRVTAEPYRVLMAEMMLRRTRAAQVVPIYEYFLRQFPNLQTLAGAEEEDVRQLLWPLGLAWRVPAFRQLAQRLVAEHHSVVPREKAALLSLPGVGEYVADAVRCLAFHEPVALIDVNTVRIAGRYFGFPVHAESRRSVEVKQAVTRLVDFVRPRESNLALLDFAATVCRARHPLHERCPVAARCASWQAELAQRRKEKNL